MSCCQGYCFDGLAFGFGRGVVPRDGRPIRECAIHQLSRLYLDSRLPVFPSSPTCVIRSKKVRWALSVKWRTRWVDKYGRAHESRLPWNGKCFTNGVEMRRIPLPRRIRLDFRFSIFAFPISDLRFGYRINMTFGKSWEYAQYTGFRSHTTIRGLGVKF
jgi:hypothetical protein